MAFQYLEQNCVFAKLTPYVLEKCGDFICENDKEINEFFHNEFSRYAENCFCKSYCFIHKKDKRIVAAFTLSASSISVKNNKKLNQPALESNILGQGLPQYPSILLGQLAVFKGYNGLKIGYQVVDFVKAILCDINPSSNSEFSFCNIGFKFIIVDAKNIDYIINMYKDSGFDFAFTNPELKTSKNVKMFLDISTLK